MVEIRSARLDDAERILEIYDYYVTSTAVSFEYETPSLDEFKRRMEKTMENYPYLVVLKNGRVEGYSYAGPLSSRPAYYRSCELTIYLDKAARRAGLGRMLYTALETELFERGFQNLYACVAVPENDDEYLTGDSAAFHARLGFETVGRFNKCGNKFGRRYSVVWMEKLIG